jgi:hypothetical protein
MRVVDLVAMARKLADPEIWRMISVPPTQAMSDLAKRLEDVRAVYGHIANDPAQRRRWATHFSPTSRRHSALPKATAQARAHAEQVLTARKTAYEAAFAEAGLVVHVYARAPAKDEGYAWPHVYFASLLETSSIQEWLSAVERFFEVCQTLETRAHELRTPHPESSSSHRHGQDRRGLVARHRFHQGLGRATPMADCRVATS